MKILAVIQARGGSKGIPKKNIYPLNGYPLISYSIVAALKSKYITNLVVSTDSEEIAQVSMDYGAEVPFMRPEELAGDKVFSVDSLHHATLESEKYFNIKYDLVIELPCVSPLRDHEDVDKALEKLISSGADSVISMVDTGEKHPVRLKRLVNDQIKDFSEHFPEPGQNSRRQDLKPQSFIRNGAIYSMKRNILINTMSRHGEDSLAFIMPDYKSVNIDTYEDLKVAEYKIKNGECNNNPWEAKILKKEEFIKSGSEVLLISTPLHFLPDQKDKLIDSFSCIFAPNASKEEVIDLFSNKKIDGWLCSPAPKYTINEEVLKNAKSLKVIATPSTGSNHIDKNYCGKNNIEVFALKDTDFVNSIYASSEFAFSLILSVARNLPQAAQSVLGYQWREVEDKFRGIELRGKNLGIIGYGRIGSNVASYALAMGMNVNAYDPYVEIEKPVNECNSHEEVLQDSDILLIAVHLDDDTANMVDISWFKKMKKGSTFINISRGEIVNEKDLIQALEMGLIKSAGLDVIRDELSMEIKSSEIINYAKSNSNLIITPHIAGLTIDSEAKAADFSITRIKEFFS